MRQMLWSALVALVAAGCGGDDKKTTSSCAGDGECTGGYCYESTCHAACTERNACDADELCARKTSAGGADVSICMPASAFSGCVDDWECEEALVAGPCDHVACREDVGLCAVSPREDGEVCWDANGTEGTCEGGACTADACPPSAVFPEDCPVGTWGATAITTVPYEAECVVNGTLTQEITMVVTRDPNGLIHIESTITNAPDAEHGTCSTITMPISSATWDAESRTIEFWQESTSPCGDAVDVPVKYGFTGTANACCNQWVGLAWMEPDEPCNPDAPRNGAPMTFTRAVTDATID